MQNPDHVRIRGIELRSGDIGIVELNHPGDGIFDSFLQRPGVAPHTMLYDSRRIRRSDSRAELVQPSLIEIDEGGWRSVPLAIFARHSHRDARVPVRASGTR